MNHRKPRSRRRPEARTVQRRLVLEHLEERTLLSATPTVDSAGVSRSGLGSYTDNFPTNATYPEYLSPAEMDYHAPTSIYLSGEGTSPSLVYPHITPGSPTLDNPVAGQSKPITTSEWWSSLVFRRVIDQSAPFFAMQPHPLSLLPHADGLGMAYVTTPEVVNVGNGDPRGPGSQYVQYNYPVTAPGSGVLLDDLKVGLQELTNTDPDKLTVYDYSDWTVTANWDGKMRATAGHGLPFVSYEFPAGGNPQISFDASQPAVLKQNFQNGALLVQVGSHYYGIFAPTAAATNWDTSNAQKYILHNLTAQTGYLSVAIMPDGFNPSTDIPTTFELFRSHAYNFVTGSLSTYAYNPSTGQLVTTLALTSVFKDNPADNSLDKTSALQALYPHQWLALSGGTTSSLTYTSARGTMKLLAAGSAVNQFQTSLQYQGILPFLPDVNGGVTYHENLWKQQLLPYLQLRSSPGLQPNQLDLSNLIRGGDVYSLGQSMLGAAQLVPLLDQVAQSLQSSSDTTIQAEGALAATYASAVLDRVKDEMGAWLSVTDDNRVKFLYFDRNFNALLATPGAYESSDSINDQHLGFGYFIKTAALIATYDPSWAAPTAMGSIIDLIIKEVANGDIDTRGSLLPRLRNFDPYAGHSWADGSANSGVGNNQESSSEALNFASGLIQWGEATGDTSLRDLGIYLFTTESNSVNYYYFNQQNTVNPGSHAAAGYDRPQVTILESVGGEYQTFFGLTPAIVETIQFVPYTGSSLYLADLGRFMNASGQPVFDTNYNELSFQAGVGQPGSNPLNVYQNPLYMFRALQSQAQATASLSYLFNAQTGQANYLPFDGAPGTDYSSNNGVDNPAFNAHWLNMLASYGKPDRTITANATSYAVFVSDSGTQKTYVAFNATNAVVTVTFSDGYVLNVPARSLKTSAGIASGSPASDGLNTPLPGRSLATPTNRLFLSSGSGSDASQGSFTIGQTGAFESRVVIPGANNGAVTAGLQARIPPNAPAAIFTMNGLNGTYNTAISPSTPLQFQIWLDGGVVPEQVQTSKVGLLFEIFNNGGTGTTSDYFVRYADYALPSSSDSGIITGFLNSYDETYGGGVVDFTGKSAGQSIPNPPTLNNATVRITLYTSLGLTPVTVRVNAAGPQGRVTYVDIPYTLTASTPTVTVASSTTGTTVGQPINFTATVSQVGSGGFSGQIQFFDGNMPIGSPLSPSGAQTANGITTATATLTGYTALVAGIHQIRAEYFTPASLTYISVTSGGSGQIVKLLGTNLNGTSKVTFGGVDAASFQIDSPNQITAVVGAGGTGPVVATTPQGSVSPSSAFTFVPSVAAPSLTDYSPASAGPGAVITLTGANFTGVTAVRVGGAPVASFTFQSSTQIMITLSQNSASGPIEVVTPGGVASSANLADPTKRRFLIGGTGPTIDTISTQAGGDGQVIVIAGQWFTGTTNVTIGGTPVKSFHVDVATQITAVVGTGASGAVVVTTPSGVSASYQLFSYGSSDAVQVTSQPTEVRVAGSALATPTVSVATSYPRLPYAITTSSLVFTATVQGTAAGIPTGSVVFLLNGEQIAEVALDAMGAAQFAPDKPFLPGNYQLEAFYTGSLFYTSGISAAASQVVTRINPLIDSVDAVSNPSVGGLVILRAKLTSQYPANGYAPSGQLDFYDGTTKLGTGNLSFDPGVFTFTMAFPAEATATIHNIRVEYRGDSYYYPDSFPACGYPLTILPATQTLGLATTTTVSAMVSDTNTPQAVIGQHVFFNASIVPTSPPAGFVGYTTGKLVFEYQAPFDTPTTWHAMDGNNQVLLLYYSGRSNVDESIVANLPSFAPTAAGLYKVRVQYTSQIDFAGNPNPQFLDSTGTFELNVVPPPSGQVYPTALTLTSSQLPGRPANTTVLDEGVILTATVTSSNAWTSGPFAGMVTADGSQLGSVQYYLGGAPYAVIPVSPTGVAQLILTSLPAGTTKWSASYVPDAGVSIFAASQISSTLTHVVVPSDPARLSVLVTSPTSPLNSGQPATISVTVSGQSALELGVPGGNVQIKVMKGTTDYGGLVALDDNGQATFTTTNLAAGTYSVTAIYNADGSDPYFPSKGPKNTATVTTFSVFDPNQPPTNSLPGSALVASNSSLTFSNATGNAIRVADPDAGSYHLGVTLVATHGVVSLSQMRGLTLLQGDGTSDERLAFTGTLADLNAALDGLRFFPSADFHGMASLTITTDDRGNRGSGGALTDSDAIAITVRGPILSAIPDVTVDEGQTIRFVASASDPDTPGASIRYSLGAGAPAGATINAITGAFEWISTTGLDTRQIVIVATELGLINGQNHRSVQVVTRNVSPTVNQGGDAVVNQGEALKRLQTFQDPGSDLWHAWVDYGDGSAVQSLIVGSDKSLILDHVYTRPGQYTVTTHVVDEAATAIGQFVVTVAPTSNGPTVQSVTYIVSGKQQVLGIAIAFDRPLEISSAETISNYVLRTAGKDRRFGTRDDQKISLTAAKYDPASGVVTLVPLRPLQRKLVYQLVVNSRPTARPIADQAGKQLDGDRNGQPGGAFIRRLDTSTPAHILTAVNSRQTARKAVPDARAKKSLVRRK